MTPLKIYLPIISKENPMPYKEVHLIDASHWRWPTPLNLPKKQGEQGWITKATEGTTWIDDYYDDWQIEADERNIPFGSFHYWRAAYDAQVQAKHYFDIATAYGRPLFPPIIDVEKYNNTGVRTLNAASAHLHAHVLETEFLWGEKPWIYTSYYVVKDLLGNPSWLGDYPLFVASYRETAPAIPVPWQGKPKPEYELWQHSKTWPIEGAAFAGYDGDWWRGTQASYDAFLAERAPEPIVPKPAFPFPGMVSLPTNINVFDIPMGNKIGLIPHECGVYVHAEERDAEEVKWYKLGDGSYVKAKYIIPVE